MSAASPEPAGRVIQARFVRGAYVRLRAGGIELESASESRGLKIVADFDRRVLCVWDPQARDPQVTTIPFENVVCMDLAGDVGAKP